MKNLFILAFVLGSLSSFAQNRFTISGYISDDRDGIHILDLVQTAQLLNKACIFANNEAKDNTTFLFVGTKPQAAAIIAQEAKNCNSGLTSGMPSMRLSGL